MLNQQAVLLIDTIAQQQVVRRCCAYASSRGVRSGMTVALARALLPATECEIITESWNPYKDARALYKLAVLATTITPLVALDFEVSKAFRKRSLATLPPEYWGLVLDITGTERVHGGFEALSQKLADLFRAQNITAQVAIAPSIGTAWALSRCSPQSSSATIITERSYMRLALAPLPVASLRIESATITALQELGIETIAELCKLSRKKLGQRFGAMLLTRLDQAFGAVDEPQRMITLPVVYTTQRSFVAPLTNHQNVRDALVDLIMQLARILVDNRRRARSFVITIQGRDRHGMRQSIVREVALVSAIKSSQVVASVLQPVVEQLVCPHGVEHIQVVASITEQAHEQQSEILGANSTRNLSDECAALVNYLVLCLGRENVRYLKLHQSYVPERAFSYQPVDRNSGASSSYDGTLTVAERPTQILQQPEPALALSLLPDKPPTVLQWRGASYRIQQGIGPERIAAEWWCAPVNLKIRDRDYFKIQDHTGRWLWVYRDNRKNDWFVHGVWG